VDSGTESVPDWGPEIADSSVVEHAGSIFNMVLRIFIQNDISQNRVSYSVKSDGKAIDSEA
jgi:hypothetical protein